ncbi:MAG: membrane protein insertion efficiency factor YidD, partial [Lachnospiraceae bacterium]|nr:membrane protein insertion efficiency factor YidD [Lachnospiraceae bacterium]
MGRPLISMVRFYQRNISPLKKAPTCRFYPVCSVYAIQAIERFGIFKGTALALWRVLR